MKSLVMIILEMPYPATPEQIVRTLYTYIEGRKLDGLLKILTAAKPSLVEGDYDNWDGGTTPYFLYLEIPASVFAGIENIDETEQLFTDCLRQLFRSDRGDVLSSVRFRPSLEEGALIPAAIVLKDDAYRIWKDGFRLFISHSSVQKFIAARLQSRLAEFGINAFVAHSDIEPSSIWKNEIEIALRSMHAMVALVSPDFNNSVWANQEVGYALGRSIAILPVIAGSTPMGFLGEIQGLPITASLPSLIVEKLMKFSSTHFHMRRALCRILKDAGSFKEATRITMLLPEEPYSEEERSLLLAALAENRQVYGASGVPEQLNKLIR